MEEKRFPRIPGYDLARALAVFGMVVVNYKLVMGAAKAGPHWLLSAADLLEGRAVATFVVLAGAGMSLLTRRAREEGDEALLRRQRRSLWKRAGWLFVIGLLYTPLWPADILHFYGIYIAFGAFLLTASDRTLLTWAGVFTAAFVVLISIFDYETGWDFETLHYSGFWTPAGLLRHLFFNGFHPVVPWTAFLLYGLWLGRRDMADPTVARRMLAFGLVLMLATEGLSALLVRTFGGVPAAGGESAAGAEVSDAVYLFGTAPMPPMPLYLLAGAGAATAIIAASILVAKGRADSPLLRPLLATGKLALTLYVAHVVLGMGTLEALGRLENQSAPFAIGSAALFFLLSVLFSHAWLSRFRLGPLEWLLRKLTQ